MVNTPSLVEFLNQAKFSVAIFDLDNTLIDLNVEWGPLKVFLKKKHEEMFGTPRDFTRLMVGLEDVQKEYGQDKYEFFSNLIGQWEIKAARTRAVERKNQTNILRQLRQAGKNIAIFTGNYRESAEIALKRFGLLQSVDVIVGRCESPKLKPDPSGLQVILAHFGIPPEDAVYVGDADVDRAAGEAAGIRTYLVS